MPNTNPPALELKQLIASAERPFPSCPLVSRYFPATAIEDARKRLARAIERGDGPGLVVGAPGTGKSLLLQVLAAQYHERFDVVLLACARICTRRALLQAILFELGLPYRSRDEGELRLGLLDQLLAGEPDSSGLLLLVDEAQALSTALLDELRVLTNVVRKGAPRVRLILAGSSALEETFAHPELESFSQRLAARTYLAPFTRHETVQYVRAQVAASGGAPERIFMAGSLDAIFDATDGAPRLINQLCDHALLLAEAEGLQEVDSRIVQMAWSDLQQLPATWAGQTVEAKIAEHVQSPTIEFGRLDDASSDDSTPFAESVADSELTELDQEEECDDFIPRKSASGVAATEAMERRRSRQADGDPFAEEFDEEEVVLDSFASWDNVIRGQTPRVENLRDREFASRVHDAMLPASDTPTTGSGVIVEAKKCTAVDECSQPAINKDECIEDETCDSDYDWAPIRLAVVDAPPRLTPISLIKQTNDHIIAGAAAFDPVMPEHEDFSAADPTAPPHRGSTPRRESNESSLTCNDRILSASSYHALNDASPTAVDEDPILVIESDVDECRQSQPPVRRESYRNLFSRLRSG